MKKIALILTAGSLLLGIAHAATIAEVCVVDAQGSAYALGSVAAFITYEAGDVVRDAAEIRLAIAQDVRRMRESGRFSYVDAQMEMDGDAVTLVYAVTSRKVLRRVEIVGNTAMSSRKVFRKSELSVGAFVDEAALALAAGRIEAAYRDAWYPEVEVVWRQELDEAAGTVDVILEIQEGPRQAVGEVVFTGDSRIVDRGFWSRTFRSLIPVFLRRDNPDAVPAKHLRALLQQRETRWYSFITGTGRYEPDAIEADRFSIRSYYMDNGFLDATVSGPEIREGDSNEVELVYSIDEGSRYTIGSVSIVGVESVDAEALRAGIALAAGDVARYRAIEAGSEHIRSFYGDRGYVRVGVRPVLDANAATGRVDVRYEVTEGRVGRIEEILITGQERSRDKIIRRELVVHPGELYHRTNTQTSERRLRNLNFFRTVSIVPEPTGEEGQYRLHVQVEEKPTGQFMAGVGFSSVDDLVAYVELSQGNFDIAAWPPVGAAQRFRVRAQVGTSRNDVLVSFTEPWLWDRPLSFGIDLYHREASYYSDVYEQKTDGMRVSLGHRITDFTRATLSYSLEQFEVFDVESTASPFFQREEGTRTKSGVALTLLRNTTDHYMLPTRGNRTSITPSVAGDVLGGETDIYGVKARSTQFFPLLGGTVLNVRGEIEAVEHFGDSPFVPIFDRLFLGGPYSLRGFKYRDVGPMDVNGEPIGGRSSAFVTVEYLIPIWSMVRGAVFYDAGFVNEEAFDYDPETFCDDWGLGFRFDIPSFPLQLDYAWPLNYDSAWHEDKGRFNFNIGHTF